LSKYYDLIKSNIIEFDRLLLDKYYQLNLNEVDTILLIKLHNLIKQGNKFPSSSLLASQMYITEDQVGERIVDLVNRGFIDMLLSSVDSKEHYCLDATYRRLGLLLEDEERKATDKKHDLEIKKIVNLLETEWKKLLSSLELEIVARWVTEKNYTFDNVKEAVLRGLKQKQTNIKYVDRILTTMHQDVEEVQKDPNKPNIKELFEEVYFGAKRNL